MAFSSAVDFNGVFGARRISTGTFTNTAGSTGGAMATGLKFIHSFVYSLSSHVDAPDIKVAKNSASAGQVTITTSRDVDGDWIAIGL